MNRNVASNTPHVLQEEPGFVFGKGRSLVQWRPVQAWAKSRELEPYSGLCCSIIDELRCIAASLTASLSPCLKQGMITDLHDKCLVPPR